MYTLLPFEWITKALVRALEHYRIQCPVCSLLAQSWMSFKASRRRPEYAFYLILHLMTTTPPLTQLLPHWLLIDSNLRVGQNVLLTNS